MANPIRIGIVGAGNITRERHIPGFHKLKDVEITGVVNSCAETTTAVAKEFGIPQTFDDWQDLINSTEIDAVVIGTWPNLHCEVTCAALEAGKHVLTQARMARNLSEAKLMLECAKKHQDLVSQVVPSPFGLECGTVVESLIKDHFLGDLREVIVLGATDQFWDYSKQIHPRQCADQSGNNALALGILHETLMRWIPAPIQVFAQSEIFEPTRPNPDDSTFTEVTVPDSIQILTEFKGGARGIYHLSGVTLFGPGLHIHLYGSRGTIKLDFNDGKEAVMAGRANGNSMEPLNIPEEDRGEWQVEEHFITAIQGKRKIDLTTFEAGVNYMEFIEAVARSAETNAPVSLPIY